MDRQLQLAKQGHAETRAMLYKVGIKSEIHTFTIMAIGDVVGSINYIGNRDMFTGIDYHIYPEGAQGYCTAGVGKLALIVRLANIGAISGSIRLRIIDDMGVVLLDLPMDVEAGGTSVPINIVVDMPGRNYGITVEVTP